MTSRQRRFLFVVFLLLSCFRSHATVHYVDLTCTNPVPPFADWTTAATNIQDAVDAAMAGDMVLVTNGLYQYGGYAVNGTTANRVAVTKPLTLQSVNGPLVTFIQGFQNGLTIDGYRSVYLTTNCLLSGFSLVLGQALGNASVDQNGGGIYCESASAVVTNCILAGNTGLGEGGGGYQGTYLNCIFKSNSIGYYGGAVNGGILFNCIVETNSGNLGGGGAESSIVINCALLGNTTSSGGAGGGADNCILTNCTLIGNWASTGGGANASTLYNSIVYFNSNNCSGCNLTNCCTTPSPAGDGNISGPPQLVDNVHLASSSPCRGAGSASYSTGTDIDGEPWLNPPSIGCDEYYAGDMVGPLAVSIATAITNAITTTSFSFQGTITGQYAAFYWSFGDGTIVSNQLAVSHTWSVQGDYPVVLTAYNIDYPAGVSATVIVHLLDNPVHYVSAQSTNPVSPYTSWDTAADNIQDAVDAAYVGGSVLVTNGVYETGGRTANGGLTNRLVLTRTIPVRSLNGPAATIIRGYQPSPMAPGPGSVRCVYMGSGAFLAGFTLSDGGTLAAYAPDTEGGGAWCVGSAAVVSNCVFRGNFAYLSGGGAFQGTLLNCTFSNNVALVSGGACISSTMNDCLLVGNYSRITGGGTVNCTMTQCTIVGNKAGTSGGGTYSGSLKNCILYFNNAPFGSNYMGSTLTYCCSMPAPASSPNISSDPLLADASHISAGSPCRGAGLRFTQAGPDIDGEPWLLPPSIGCDEYYSGSVTGMLQVTIGTDYTNAMAGITALKLVGNIAGHAGSNVWDFGDGTVLSNHPLTTHTWAAPGMYPVTFTAYNSDNPAGVSAELTVQVFTPFTYEGSIHYANVLGTNPVPPYTSWATAATNIQAAVDAASPGDQVIVADGLYQIGGVINYSAAEGSASFTQGTRVWVSKAVRVQSVNGQGAATIAGASSPATTSASRCVYLANGAWLEGFTLTNGAVTQRSDAPYSLTGGGVMCEGAQAIVRNCLIVSNWAVCGGGAFSGTLYNCVLSNNQARANYTVLPPAGAGSCSNNLFNCTLANNFANEASPAPSIVGGFGGGAYYCAMDNCLVASNRAAQFGGGVYSTWMTNCILMGNVAGKSGGGAYNSASSNVLVSCVLVGNKAAQSGGGAYGLGLSNCNLSGNYATNSGGGAYSGTLASCMVVSNISNSGGGAYNSVATNCTFSWNLASSGGGIDLGTANDCLFQSNSNSAAQSATLNNCVLVGNSTIYAGGGANSGTLNNCVIVSNSAAVWAGGIYAATANNCIVYYNTGGKSVDADNTSTLNHCCTTYTGGFGCISNEPGFVNLLAGDFHLQTNSPCINSGDNSTVTTATDFDGRPRIVNGTVDIGPYEYQGPRMAAFLAWLAQHGLSTSVSSDFADPDGDGMNNWQEWLAGTDPTNGQSVLRAANPSVNPAVYGIQIHWPSVAGRTYFVERTTNLHLAPFQLLADNIQGLPGTTSYIDTSVDLRGSYFYRIGIDATSVLPTTAFSVISFAWLQQYGLPIDGSADFADADGDGINNWLEWKTGSNPIDPSSVFQVAITNDPVNGWTLTWPSASGVYYFVQGSTLANQQGFQTINVGGDIRGQTGTTSYTVNGAGPFFRVGVRLK